MQLLGQCPGVALVGAHRLRDKRAAHVEQCRHARGGASQEITQGGHRSRQPQQQSEVGVHHVRQLNRVVTPGVDDPHGEIPDGGA
ncbi:MAG: hypothetical protein ACLPLP_01240, partial [Mycobacterium sp.]